MNPIDNQLAYQQFRLVADGLAFHTPALVTALAVFAATLLLNALVTRGTAALLQAVRLSPAAVVIGRLTTGFLVTTTGVVTSLLVLFPQLTPLSALTTVLVFGIGLGFLVNHAVESWVAGLYLLVRRPFVVGDTVECGDIEGEVECISTFNTVIRQSDGLPATLPNACIWRLPLTLKTIGKSRCVNTHCLVADASDLEKVRDQIRDVVASSATVDQNHAVRVLARDLSPEGVDFEVSWWTTSDADMSANAVLTEIGAALNKPKRRPARRVAATKKAPAKKPAKAKTKS